MDNNHTQNGKFAKGNKASPGRKPKAVEDDFIVLIDKAVKPEDWIEILDKAVVLAKRGDSRAREWLTERRFGKVKDQVEHSGDMGVTLLWQPHKPKSTGKP
jgi:hypothetical protein